MPNVFEESEFEQDLTEEETADAVDSVMESLEEQHQQFDERMSEVESRLEVAQYYKVLLNDDLFDNTSECAKTVQKEIRGFVKSRLEFLLGIKSEVKATTEQKVAFTLEEVTALKALASKVMGKPQLLEVKNQSAKPSIKKAEAPAPTVQTSRLKKTTQVLKNPAPKKKPTVTLPDDPDVFEENGRLYKRVMRSDGMWIKQPWKPPVGQVKNSAAKPTPTKSEMEAITQMQALQSINSAVGMTSDKMKAAIALSLKEE